MTWRHGDTFAILESYFIKKLRRLMLASPNDLFRHYFIEVCAKDFRSINIHKMTAFYAGSLVHCNLIIAVHLVKFVYCYQSFVAKNERACFEHPRAERLVLSDSGCQTRARCSCP